MMVKNVTVDRLGHAGASGQSVAFDRHLISQHPARTIHVVHERLRHVIARNPAEMILGAALPLEFTEARLPLGYAVGCPEKILLDGDDVADSTVPNALHRFDITLMEPAMQTGDDTKLFLFRQIAGLL